MGSKKEVIESMSGRDRNDISMVLPFAQPAYWVRHIQGGREDNESSYCSPQLLLAYCKKSLRTLKNRLKSVSTSPFNQPPQNEALPNVHVIYD